MKELTKGILTTVLDGKIDLGELQNDVGINEGESILLIGTRSKFIRLIPIEDPEIALLRVCIAIDSFEDASHLLLKRMRNLKLKLIHSTGFCPLSDRCIWEGYFSGFPEDKMNEFRTWLDTLDMVLETELHHLHQQRQ
ncbi:MAG: hypothetical protein GF309_14950 [Candidatus Lokiarchaeota archaeon]|jgi:hypothetical protein|nr:hypothetical protein [Candidatus Lokiarchaeota archaeon]